MMDTLNWHNLYKSGWQNEIVPAAFAHPAKFSRRLIAHIYNHLLTEGLVKPGDRVCDPFGGVALGALDAMRLGLHWTGVELESKQNGGSPFLELGNENISLWNKRYAGMPNWGSAQLLQGDSRNFAAIVGQAHAAISSPPYAHISPQKSSDGVNLEKQYLTYRKQGGGASFESFSKTQQFHSQGYGSSLGQLSELPEGNYAAAISSPPYAEARIGEVSGAENVGHNENYGNGHGQLGNMQGGDFSAAVSSPPYANSINSGISGIDESKYGENSHGGGRHGNVQDEQRYGYSDGQLGAESGETFWLASRTIVEQVHAVLAPGAVSVWIVKDFVRAKARVPFCDQWRELCEHIGFETMYVARAWLVENHGTQYAQDGNHKSLTKSRKSFFRRLNEAKGAPRIDYEQVVFMQKR